MRDDHASYTNLRHRAHEKERVRAGRIASTTAFLVFGILALVDGMAGKTWIATMEAFGALLSLAGGVTGPETRTRRILLAIGPAYVLWMFIVGYWTDDARGAAVMWMFLLPPLVFYLFGTGRGLVTLLPFVVLLSVWLWHPDSLATELMPLEYRARGFVAFVLLIAVTAVFELSRSRTAWELEKATHRIHELESMLPVCSKCQKIRSDDDWQDLESYLGEHLEVVFSHALCPDCLNAVERSSRLGDRDSES